MYHLSSRGWKSEIKVSTDLMPFRARCLLRATTENLFQASLTASDGPTHFLGLWQQNSDLCLCCHVVVFSLCLHIVFPKCTSVCVQISPLFYKDIKSYLIRAHLMTSFNLMTSKDSSFKIRSQSEVLGLGTSTYLFVEIKFNP